MKNKNYFKLNLIYFTALVLVAVIFILSYFGLIVNDWISSFLIQILVMASIPLLMYKLMFRRSFKSTLKDFGFKKISAKSILIIIVLGFILYFLNSYIATFFSTIISLFSYERITLSPSTTPITTGLFLQEFLLTAILPAICEEILHRGLMLNCAKKTYNTRYCLFISSILFGLTHLNINQFFYASILGFLMGYVNLICDSIYPSIIIHFMNNFLSIYFSYGTALDWPLAKFIYNIELLISSNIFVFILIVSIAIIAIILLFVHLTNILKKETAKTEIINIVSCLKLNKLTLNEAQAKLNEANKILKTKSIINKICIKPKTAFIDKIFLISSITLGACITICSFIWGII